ncbi:DUF2059 domain-containing protein [Sphingomonas changnyeongensis]|uniref:DUF2059 domain-containing protein n=1 Tax=Sphingomonas changnyeongensis TaxID=2698679 RepID=A0A7Z2NXP5_9SPHN|nr:DUF2059 domain-containing protein [Sphingomonas changnyeongensis]QHL91672.1 DUF2059 domain-containing protein [Sphingomonas changnyeongensis]
MVIAAAIAPSAMAVAQPASPAPLATAATPSAAAQLVEIMIEPEKTLAATRKQSLDQLMSMLRSDPNAVSLDKQRPGLFDAVAKAVDAELQTVMAGLLVKMRDRYVGAIESRLTAKEMDDLLSFYRSPTGQRLIEQTRQAGMAKGGEAVAQAMAEKRTRIDASDVSAVNNAALAAAMQAVRPEDVPLLAAMARNSATPKIAALQNELGPVIMADTNKAIEASLPRLMERLQAATRQHLGVK